MNPESALGVREPSHVRSPSRCLQIMVEHPMVREALSATSRDVGWTVVSQRGTEGVLVTDIAVARPIDRVPGNQVVLVVDPTPLAARRALDAVSNLVVGAVMLSDDPGGLKVALDGLAAGRLTVPIQVVNLAARMPHLSERQLAILGGIIAGQSNSEIARAMHLSHASIKRELGFIYQIVASSGRSSLVGAALQLGLSARATKP